MCHTEGASLKWGRGKSGGAGGNTREEDCEGVKERRARGHALSRRG